MKAAQITAPRQIEVVAAEEPQILDAGQVKIRLERACLCGSDMPFWGYDHAALAEERLRDPAHKDLPSVDPYPMRLGQSIHECIGTVVESSSDRFQESDLVLALPEAQAGLCEYICAPEDKTVNLPREGVPREEILMTQPLGTVIWAMQKLGNLLDQDAVVVGQGPMGLLITQMLANMGCRTVIALDKLDYRLNVAKKMQATHTVNVDQEDAETAVRDITGGKMADLVLEAVGHREQTLNECIKLIRHRGTVLCFGLPDDAHYSFEYSRFFRSNLSLIASVGPDVIPNFSLARDMIAQGRINVAPLVTHILPFQEIQHGYELFVDRLDGAIKVVIDYDSLRN